MTPNRPSPLLDISDVEDILRRRNPDTLPHDIRETSHVVTTVAAVILGLPEAHRRRLALHADELAAKLVESIDLLDARAQLGLAESSPEPFWGPEFGHSGFRHGPRSSLEEGLGWANAPTTRMEDWSGPVAGSGELERRLGIARSTLQDWRRAGSVIGLLKGARKHVFPLAQFVDGRPVEGLAQLQTIIGNPRSAWLWLVKPNADDRRAPLERLKSGEIDAVVALAHKDFA